MTSLHGTYRGLASRRDRSHCAADLRALTMTACAALLIALCGIAAAQEQKKPAEALPKLNLGQIIERAGQGVVRITVESQKGEGIGFGSGFLIDPKGLVATNLHVVRSAAKARIEFRDGTKVRVKGLRAFDKMGDLAILEIEQVPAKATPLPLGPRALPAQGDVVTAIGHPGGLNFSATDGIVSAVRKKSDGGAPVPPEDDRTWVQTTAAIAGGSSGGPLLSDTGQVVGINTMVVQGRGIGFAVHVSHLIDLLDKANGAALQPLPADPGSDLFNPLAEFTPRVEEMYMEYQNALREYRLMVERTAPILRKGFAEKNDPGPKYAQRFIQIAEHDRRSTTAFQALYMASLIDNPEGPAGSLKRALDLMIEDHAKEKWLAQALPGLSRQTHEAVPVFLRKVLERNPHRNVQGAACCYLAIYLKDQPKHDDDEILALLERCAGEFKDVQVEVGDPAQEVPLGKAVATSIDEYKYRSVGKKAPEILGTDADGQTFKLSDYRGKIVVLDFFADWCPYCVRMYPEERELVQALAGKPFMILGVNCDSRDTLQQIIAEKKVTWRCWSDGKGGPIAEAWHLDSYPRMYVIDQDGVIRHKFVGQTAPGLLRKTVTQMLEALPGGKPAQKEEAPAKKEEAPAQKEEAPAQKEEAPTK